jgi:tetratricopeptide (TPR) repeat protein
LKSGHFKVSSGATYLKTGVEADVSDNAQRALDSGERVLLEAMQQNQQANNPAAWYYLGRIYLQRGDLYGADSALTRAEKLAPGCVNEIDGYRRNGWVALIKGGNGFEEQESRLRAGTLPPGRSGVPQVGDPVLSGGGRLQRAGRDR